MPIKYDPWYLDELSDFSAAWKKRRTKTPIVEVSLLSAMSATPIAACYFLLGEPPLWAWVFSIVVGVGFSFWRAVALLMCGLTLNATITEYMGTISRGENYIEDDGRSPVTYPEYRPGARY